MYRHFDLFSDGSCKGANKPGGWANVIRATKEDGLRCEYIGSGGDPETTNNRMELMAVLKGLERIHALCSEHTCANSVVVSNTKVRIISDSSYVVNGINKWVYTWVDRGWRTASNKPVKNRDLWEQVYPLIQEMNIEAIWVAGHIGHPENERCDKMAKDETTKLLKKANGDKYAGTV